MTLKDRLHSLKDTLFWSSSRMLWVVGALVLLVILLIIAIVVVVINSKPSNEDYLENPIFVGKFLSDPRRDPQINMWEIYQRKNSPVETVNSNVSMIIQQAGYKRYDFIFFVNNVLQEHSGFQLSLTESQIVNLRSGKATLGATIHGPHDLTYWFTYQYADIPPQLPYGSNYYVAPAGNNKLLVLRVDFHFLGLNEHDVIYTLTMEKDAVVGRRRFRRV
ncbi:hypothetical protein RvY_01833 [Ramazzottius varieornatus]|uniref:Uncharacterized protein n=1 Tax=Ramazzottius varieornatus TaxID=947166 RepID=A0A1D1UHR6_RAMVA|nr:hypothetical protein RvY_01833 [Ramazzottius varieornatus]